MRAEAVKTLMGVTAGSTLGMSWLEAKIRVDFFSTAGTGVGPPSRTRSRDSAKMTRSKRMGIGLLVLGRGNVVEVEAEMAWPQQGQAGRRVPGRIQGLHAEDRDLAARSDVAAGAERAVRLRV